jgi:hypothetical protein
MQVLFIFLKLNVVMHCLLVRTSEIHHSYLMWYSLNLFPDSGLEFKCTMLSTIMLRRSNFISSVQHEGPQHIYISHWEVRPSFLKGLFTSLQHILDGVHIRCSWWPVNKCISLPWQSFSNHIWIMNEGVVLLEPDYFIRIKHTYRQHQYTL